jgi:hypothetical protein
MIVEFDEQCNAMLNAFGFGLPNNDLHFIVVTIAL